MKNISEISDELLTLIDFYIKKIDGKVDKTLEFYLQIENKKTGDKEWIRIVVYAYTTYRIIAYTICQNKNDLNLVNVLGTSADHDSAWRYSILENILRREKVKKQKRPLYNYHGFIDSMYLCTANIEKNFKEHLLFVNNENRKSLNIHIK